MSMTLINWCDPPGCCCQWWDNDYIDPPISELITADLQVDLVFVNKPLCKLGFAIWGYYTGGTGVEAGVAVWQGPTIYPGQPDIGPPSGASAIIFYAYQGEIVFEINGQNIYLGTLPVSVYFQPGPGTTDYGSNYFRQLVPPEWVNTGMVLAEYALAFYPDGSQAPNQLVAFHGFYTQWDLPRDPIPNSKFGGYNNFNANDAQGYLGWIYDGPIDNNPTQIINISAVQIGGNYGSTDTPPGPVLEGGRHLWPPAYFYASGGTLTEGYPF